MINFVQLLCQNHTTDSLVEALPGCFTRWDYHEVFRKRRLPGGVWIFTDLDLLHPFELSSVGVIATQLEASGCHVLNHPGAFLNRLALLKRLHLEGINDFSAYAPAAGERPVQYPVFIRQEPSHSYPLTDLIHTADELESVLSQLTQAGHPLLSLIVIEYCAEPLANGYFRKYSTFRVGDQYLTFPSVNEDKWLVKYGKAGLGEESFYEEELRAIEQNDKPACMATAFELSGLQYGRSDYGLVNGRPQIYEINPNPHVRAPRSHPSPTRARAIELFWEQLLQAFIALDKMHGNAGAEVSISAKDINLWQKLERPKPLQYFINAVLFRIRKRLRKLRKG